nr:MAG TPA: hypothetical protein [Caudoviricetes sp.]
MHFSGRSLDSLSHSIFIIPVITALTTVRDDVVRAESIVLNPGKLSN